MFNFVTTKLLMWVCAVLAAALLITGTLAGCEHHNAGAARAERDAARSQRDTALDANVSNVETIATQRRALNEWRSLQVTPEEAALSIAAHQALVNKVLELAGELNQAKEKDSARPECEALLDADFERACPATARGLRNLEGGHQDGDGRGASAGGEAAGSAPHR